MSEETNTTQPVQVPIVNENKETPPPQTPTYAYFKKVLVNMPFFVDGNRVPFEPLDQNFGVIRLSSGQDDNTIAALMKAAIAKKGGVVRIDASTYEGLKKKLPLNLSASKRKHILAVWERNPMKRTPQKQMPESQGVVRGGRSANAVAANNPSSAGVVGSRPAVGGGTAAAGPVAVPTPPSTARKSGGPTLRRPAIGQFRADAGIPNV